VELLTEVTVIGVVGLAYWLVRLRSRARLQSAIAERDHILQQLADIETKRQRAIDHADERGTVLSVDAVLSGVESLRQKYLQAGRDEDAREVERVIQEFRAENGSEIPIAKAYALMRALEGKTDGSSSGA